MSIRIQSFPYEGGEWTVLWLGEVSPNSKRADEPDIDVLIGNGERLGRIKIGVGQLPLVDIGSIWEKRVRVDRRNQMRQKLTLDTSSMRITLVELGDLPFEVLFPEDVADVFEGGRLTRLTKQRCFVIKLGDEEASRVILPCSVLIKTFYGPSSTLARAVFNGSVRNLRNLVQEETTKEHPRHLRLRPKGDLGNSDLYILGWWLHSNRAHQGAVSVSNSLANREQKGLPASAETHFPFQGTLLFHLYGTSFHGPSEEKYLFIEEIVRVEGLVFPFDSITFIRDAKPTKVRGDISRGEGSDEESGRELGEIQSITNRRPPARFAPKQDIAVLALFPELKHKPIFKVYDSTFPLEVPDSASDDKLEKEKLDEGSTAGEGPIKDRFPKVKLSALDRP